MSLDTSNLQQTFSGEIISPENPDYQLARKAFSAIGSPALVVRPKSTTDVAAAINYARDNSLTLSVRSGGHHGAGFATNDGGIVIDLSMMNSIEVYDSEHHYVRIAGGTKWGDVAQELHQHGLAISSGDTKSVGVGGLTLGGGVGWMVRKWGLTIDQLIGAEIVTANGEIQHISESENPDLFWAIRGGGGNFGVVTHFEFAAHKLSDVYAGSITYGTDDIAALLKKWRDYISTAPEELSTSITLMPSFTPEMPRSVMLLVCYSGDDEIAATKAIEPLKHLQTPTNVAIEKKAYMDVLEEAHPPKGMAVFVNSLFAPKLSDELIDTAVGIYETSSWVMQIRSVHGALNRIPLNATAFAHRDSEIMMFAGTFMPETSPASDLADAAKPWSKLAAFGSGAYLNFMSTRTGEEVSAIYPQDTRKKLSEIKRKYDPQNVFNQNYNISPAE